MSLDVQALDETQIMSAGIQGWDLASMVAIGADFPFKKNACSGLCLQGKGREVEFAANIESENRYKLSGIQS